LVHRAAPRHARAQLVKASEKKGVANPAPLRGFQTRKAISSTLRLGIIPSSRYFKPFTAVCTYFDFVFITNPLWKKSALIISVCLVHVNQLSRKQRMFFEYIT
jgi:hypothetical protein